MPRKTTRPEEFRHGSVRFRFRSTYRRLRNFGEAIPNPRLDAKRRSNAACLFKKRTLLAKMETGPSRWWIRKPTPATAYDPVSPMGLIAAGSRSYLPERTMQKKVLTPERTAPKKQPVLKAYQNAEQPRAEVDERPRENRQVHQQDQRNRSRSSTTPDSERLNGRDSHCQSAAKTGPVLQLDC